MFNLALQAGIALTRALLHLGFMVGRLAGTIIAALIVWLWRRNRARPAPLSARTAAPPSGTGAPSRNDAGPLAAKAAARPAFRSRPAFRPRPAFRTPPAREADQ